MNIAIRMAASIISFTKGEVLCNYKHDSATILVPRQRFNFQVSKGKPIWVVFKGGEVFVAERAIAPQQDLTFDELLERL